MRKTFVFLLLLIFTLSKNVLSQIPTYVWAKTTTGNVESIQRATVVDAAGNVFISGVFFGTVDFDPGAGVTNVTPVPYGCNIYIAKYDVSGNFLWIKNIPIIASYGHNSMAIDGSGNIYITGFFSGTNLDFNPGAGMALLTSVSGGNDIYIAKYDNNGNYLWAKSIGSTGSDRGNEILTDPSGNVFVTGNFALTVDFDPGIGVANLSASGTSSIFLAKYDCNGNYLWAKNIDGTGSADVRDLALSPTGNIYITGNYSATVDFDPGPGILNLSSAGNADIFFAKYDAVGNLVWAKSIGSTGIDGGTALAVNATGDVFLTGTFNLTADFDAGAGIMNLTAGITANSYIAKYDANGNYMWVKKLPLNTGNIDIMLDLTGTIFISGSFGSGPPSPIDLDPGPGVANLAVPSNLPPPYYNIFARYDGNGNYLWADVFGHTCYCSVAGYKSSMAKDNSGYIYYSGIFNGSAFGSSTVDFDPGSGIANLTASSSVDNTFFTKYGIPSTPLPVELVSFDGNNIDNINYLKWETTSEVNNEFFNVERSSDGINFKSIGKVYGNGTTSQVSHYDFKDISPFTGLNYYRLKQYDINGGYKISNTLTLNNNIINQNFSIYPSVSADIFTINIQDLSQGIIKIIDVNGKLVYKETFESYQSSIELNLSEFNNGIYFVTISDKNKIYTGKIVKK